MLHRSYLSLYGVLEGFGRDKEARPPRLLQRPNMGLGFFRIRYGYRPRLGTPLSIYLTTRVTREFGPGVELIPSRRLGISLRSEYTWGFHLGPERLIERTAPDGSTFIDGRSPFAAQYRVFPVYLIFNRLLRF